MKKFLMLFLGVCMIPSISTAAPQASKEEVRSPFVFSNLAPAPNATAKSLGVDLYLTGSGFLPFIPFVDYRYRQGFTKNLNMELRLQSLIFVNQVDIAARYVFFEGKRFSIGGRAGVGGMLILEGNDNNVLYGFPGLIASIGSEKRQFSIAADLYIPIMGKLYTETIPLPFFSIAYEMPLGKDSGIYFNVQASSKLGLLGIGKSW